MIYTLMSIYLFAHATTSAPGGCSLSLCFLKADLYDMCTKGLTAVVVFPDGRHAAAAGLLGDFSKAVHGSMSSFSRSHRLFLSIEKCIGNKCYEEKQVCKTQTCQSFLNLKGGGFLCPRSKTAAKCR